MDTGLVLACVIALMMVFFCGYICGWNERNGYAKTLAKQLDACRGERDQAFETSQALRQRLVEVESASQVARDARAHAENRMNAVIVHHMEMRKSIFAALEVPGPALAPEPEHELSPEAELAVSVLDHHDGQTFSDEELDRLGVPLKYRDRAAEPKEPDHG